MCNVHLKALEESSGSLQTRGTVRVAPPAVIHGERDYGLYSHCLGARGLSSCCEV